MSDARAAQLRVVQYHISYLLTWYALHHTDVPSLSHFIHHPPSPTPLLLLQLLRLLLLPHLIFLQRQLFYRAFVLYPLRHYSTWPNLTRLPGHLRYARSLEEEAHVIYSESRYGPCIAPHRAVEHQFLLLL